MEKGPYFSYPLRTGDYEEIMNKVGALSLLSNAVLVWNTAQMEKTVNSLNQAGQTVEPEELDRISPLANAHVIPNGTYHFPNSGGETMPLVRQSSPGND